MQLVYRRVTNAPRGFTLLELLVVLLIIGVIINFAVLSVGQHGNAQAREEIRRLAALIELAGQEAVMTSREIAVQVSRDGYSFLVLDAEKNELTAIEDDELLRPRTLPEGLSMKIDIEGDTVELGKTSEEENNARIFLLSSGEIIPPFEVSVSTKDDDKVYRLTGATNGKLELVDPDSS